MINNIVDRILGSFTGQLYIVVVSFLLWLIYSLRHKKYMFFLVVFPATVAHELTHLCVALLLNGKPEGFSVIPQRVGRGYVLGSVTCHNISWYNGIFIALAPICLFAAVVFIVGWRVHDYRSFSFSEAAWMYTTACLVYAAIPSFQDIKIALASIWLMVVSGFVIVYFILANTFVR